jgi:hypothetical protein
VCDARIRPFTNDAEVVCEEEENHNQHVGVLRNYAYAGSKTTIRWFESDRRTFHGCWPGPCEDPNCPLPLGHRGGHIPR